MAALTPHGAQWQGKKLFQAPCAHHALLFAACATPAIVLERTDAKEKHDWERHCAARPDNVAPQTDEPKVNPVIDELTVTSRIDSGVPGV
jgi:hypothetical protein